MLLGGIACLPSSSYYIFGCLTANAAETVSYLDSKGNEQFCTEYTQLTDRTTLDAGWYVVSSSVIISDRITVNGDVHLILSDSTKLTASRGINVSEGNSLTIYAQSTGDSMGMLEATGISSAAGIGGQNGAGGTVTINGGNIAANGSYYGAGIGGGWAGAGGNITVNGGVVTATGGFQSARIGGGPYGTGGTFTITGGDITAIGGDKGAGIGGGIHSASGNITITGGIVTANGGNSGAGIGGGYYGICGTVTINGGAVTAKGGDKGAGIGSGWAGAGGNITIRGGTVEAVADSDCNNAIGAGYNNNDNGTLTVSPKANQSLYVKKGESAENAESIDGSPFTAHQDNIIDKVQSNKYVKTVEANAPAYTVTIPAKVNLGETSTISADNVSVLNDFKLIVSLTKINENDKDLKLTNNDGTELKYSITNTSNNSDVKLNSTVLSLPGGTDNGSTTLSFNEPPENEVQYAGNYKGNVTFTISIK